MINIYSIGSTEKMANSLIYFLILFYIPIGSCGMRKTIKTEEYPFPRGHEPWPADQFLKVGDQEEVTVCLRFRTFAYNEGFGCPFAILTRCPEGEHCPDIFHWYFCIGWKTGLEERRMQAGQNEIYYSHDNLTLEDDILQEKSRWHLNLYEDWMELFEWQSACHSISILTKTESIYFNGKLIQKYHYTHKFKKGWGEYPLVLSLMLNWRGEVTDLNIYDSALEDDVMEMWTTSCKAPKGGEILSWDPASFNLIQNNNTKTVLGEVASEDLCQGKKVDIIEVFDDGVPKSPTMANDICARLNGQLNLIPTTEKELVRVINEFEQYLEKVNQTVLIQAFIM